MPDDLRDTYRRPPLLSTTGCLLLVGGALILASVLTLLGTALVTLG
jgi:hypothetical protein